MANFPDVERVLMSVLASLGTCGTTTPSDFTGQLPYIRINRVGGGDDRVTDVARVTIDTFHSTRDGSYNLGEAVRTLLLTFPFVVGGAVIDRVTSISAPMEVPWGDPGVRRRVATYLVACRRTNLLP